MMSLQNYTSIQARVIEFWWHNAMRKNLLFIRLIKEDINNLARLSYLKVIVHQLNEARTQIIQADYPPAVEDIRMYLLSALGYFIECLQALIINDPIKAQMRHNLTHAEISMLQYIFMTHRIKSYL